MARNKWILFGCFAILFVSVFSDFSCKRAKETSPSKSVLSTVCIEHSEGKSSCVKVEIADSRGERYRGLKFRTELDEDSGMLFIFPKEEKQFFWMKDTFIPLDMIFIDARKTIVGIIANVTPMTSELRSVGLPSKYVLEVNSGWSARNGVVTGLKVKMDFDE